jgi:hypothetical protein
MAMVNSIRAGAIIISLLFCMLVLGSSTLYVSAESQAANGAAVTTDMSDIRSYFDALSSINSRVTGYSGSYAAASYLVETFSSLGLSVITQNYTIAVPIDEGSFITVEQEDGQTLNLPAYAMWPNGVQTCATPPSGLTGRLIYVGQGRLEDFDGKVVNNTIVLMDFNSGKNWLNALDLGAQGAIFIEPEETSNYEALTKAIPIPLAFPRLYVTKEIGYQLRQLAASGATATIHVRMYWRQVQATNIIAIAKGTTYPDDIIVVSAHYDSWSIVPRLSSASDDLIGISTLLAMAKQYSIHPSARTIWFAALSGYWEGLAGPSQFVYTNLYSKENLEGSRKIWLQVGLDFSSDSSGVDLLYTGDVLHFSMYAPFTARYSSLQQPLRSYLEPLPTILSNAGLKMNVSSIVNFNFLGQFDWGTQQGFYMLDVEPVQQTGTPAFAIRTQYKERIGITPLKTTSSIRWTNVLPQFVIAQLIIGGLANEINWPLSWNFVSPQNLTVTAYGVLSYVTLVGKTVIFNVSTGWYSPLPNTLVRLSLMNPNMPLYWPFVSRFLISDENGVFKFQGLTAYMTWQTYACKLNESTGEVDYSVDMGIYGTASNLAGGISTNIYPITNPSNLLIPLFRCDQISLLGLLNPLTMMTGTVVDLRQPQERLFYAPSTAILNVFDLDGRSTPLFYGIYYDPNYREAAIFVIPGSTSIVTFNPGTTIYMRPLMVMTNSTLEDTEGFGLPAPMVIRHSAFSYASSMYILASGRLSKLVQYGVESPIASQYLKLAKRFISNAEKAYSMLNYSAAYSYSMAALSFASRAYADGVMPLFTDASSALVFFIGLAIPFSIFIGNLLSKNTRQWIFSTAAIMVFTIIAFYFVNPSLSVVSNSTMGLVGVAMVLMFAFVAYTFIRQTGEVIKYGAERRLGKHGFESVTLASTSHFILAALSQIRRRRMVSALTFSTIVSSAIALTAFTSLAPTYALVESATEPKIGSIYPTSSILVKGLWGVPTTGVLSLDLMQYLRGMAGPDYYVSPRVLYYAQPNIQGIFLPVSSQNVTINLSPGVLMGVSESDYATLLGNFTYPASWEIMFSKDPNAVIIHKLLAERLNVTIGGVIEIAGVGQAKVVGILDMPLEMSLTDLDGLSPLPADPSRFQALSFRASGIGGQAMGIPAPVAPDHVIFLPWMRVYERGGYVSAIVIQPRSEAASRDIKELARLLTTSIQWPVFAKIENSIYSYSTIPVYMFAGSATIAILLVITAISVANTMVSSVQLRKKELFTYSSVGLPPSGAYVMFLTESLVFALSSGIIGFLIGFLLDKTLLALGLLPPSFQFNFSGTFVVVAIATITLTTLASAIYPALITSRVITPSKERKWTLTSRPKGDEWVISLPIQIPADEGLGFLTYLQEYFLGVGAITSSYRVDKLPEIDYKSKRVTFGVRLTPVEMGVAQDVEIILSPLSEGHALHDVSIALFHTTGSYEVWLSRNRRFIDHIRKQMLVWRSLSPGERNTYLQRARDAILKDGEVH